MDENTWNPPLHTFEVLRKSFKGLGHFSPPVWNQGNPDANRGRFTAVPSEIVRNQLGPQFKQLKYLFQHLQNAENGIQRLGSLFSPNAESEGHHMWIGADLLLYHLESFGISWNQTRNTWNTPFYSFDPLGIRINSLRIFSPQCRITGNPDGNRGGFIVVPSGIVRNQLGPQWKHLKYPFP